MKNKTKTYIKVFIIMCLSLFVLTGCGNKEEEIKKKAEKAKQETRQLMQQEANF